MSGIEVILRNLGVYGLAAFAAGLLAASYLPITSQQRH